MAGEWVSLSSSQISRCLDKWSDTFSREWCWRDFLNQDLGMVNRGISDDNGSQTRTEESYSVVLDLTNLYIEHGATQH